MRKKQLSIILIFILFVSFSVDSKELRVGLAELDYPPFYFKEQGKYHGAALEVSRTIANRLNHQLVFVRYPWKRIQTYLQSGDVDMMILYFKTPERAKDVVYVEIPHIYESSDLFVRKNSDIKFKGDLLDLQKYSFGNVRGYSYGDEYNNAKGIFKQEVNNEEQLIRILAYGRIDIGVGNKAVILRHAKALGLSDKIRFIEPPIDISANYIAFSKTRRDAQELADEYSEMLKVFVKTDEYKAILKKYSLEVH